MDKTYFDPATHTYYYEGTEVPSVTQVLTDLGITGYTGYNPFTAVYAERGTRFHSASEAYLQEQQLDPEFFDQLMAVKVFMDTYSGKTEVMEESLITEDFGGTLDWRGTIQVSKEKMPAILDFKTGKQKQWHTVQLGGYMTLYEKLYSEEILYACVLYVDKQSLVPVSPSVAKDLWSSCLDVYQMRRWK